MRTSSSCADSPDAVGLECGSCTSARSFAPRFLQTHLTVTPLRLAILHLHQVGAGVSRSLPNRHGVHRKRPRREPGPRNTSSSVRSFLCLDGLHVDETATATAVFELDVPGDQRKQRIILALGDILARPVLGAALPHDNGTGVDQLPAKTLYAESLSVG